ncbi:hypothetical protein FHY02_003582 [Sphingomonas sp. BK069]|nr:hypothetical protein [Sphingomonas sp. BK069]
MAPRRAWRGRSLGRRVSGVSSDEGRAALEPAVAPRSLPGDTYRGQTASFTTAPVPA